MKGYEDYCIISVINFRGKMRENLNINLTIDNKETMENNLYLLREIENFKRVNRHQVENIADFALKILPEN